MFSLFAPSSRFLFVHLNLSHFPLLALPHSTELTRPIQARTAHDSNVSLCLSAISEYKSIEKKIPSYAQPKLSWERTRIRCLVSSPSLYRFVLIGGRIASSRYGCRSLVSGWFSSRANELSNVNRARIESLSD